MIRVGMIAKWVGQFALHVADMGLIASIPHDSTHPPRVVPEPRITLGISRCGKKHYSVLNYDYIVRT